MDTGTHLVVGLGLAGLAYIDPVVAADTSTATAVLIGTVLGSQAPDSDGLLRFKGNSTYIRNHRGLSHSLPAVALWTILITAAISLFAKDIAVLHLGIWVFIAVAFHVFSDLFNTYGTQAARPFTEKWISWNIIHIFDPIIFISHILAIMMWMLHIAKPAVVFPVLYAFVAVYYIWRTLTHHALEQGLPQHDPKYVQGDQYYLIPTIHLHSWNIVKRRADGGFTLGELRNTQVRWIDEVKCAEHPAVDASKSNPDVASLLYFSSFACAECKSHQWGYEVRWMDVRYRHRKNYPFVAVVLMDKEYRTLDSYVGWVSETRLEKKLRVDTY